ncbi:S2/P23 family protein [Borrelia crocidurae]|uniref:p23-like cell envelope protein n=1 Tax=Borrelia crocidurae (strain Achema) TaxID=1155096 RepID=I0FEB6_BORCA|nr:S2/P23 family protein [Borrelia crocidurae]AFI31822.1 p23-like cell envelope protein [Borrelia crocidurae str. Achema]
MNTKTLLPIITTMFFIQCNNATDEQIQYKIKIPKESNTIHAESLSKINNLTLNTINKQINSKSILTQLIKEPYEIMEGNKLITISLLFLSTKLTVTWIKNKAISIKGEDGQPLNELINKIRYSYSISPIKENEKLSNNIMPIVLFETTQNGGQDLEVTSFTLTDEPNLDFNTRQYSALTSLLYTPPKTETSQESGYANANPFWIANKNDKVIKALTKNQSIKAKIKVYNKNSKTTTEYNIILESHYLSQLIKETLQKYPQLNTVAPEFKLL